MTVEEVTVKNPSLYGPPTEVTKTVPAWVKEYQAKRQKLRDEAQGEFHYTITAPALANNTRDQSAEKGEVSRIRAELTKGLDDLKKDMKDALHERADRRTIEEGAAS